MNTNYINICISDDYEFYHLINIFTFLKIFLDTIFTMPIISIYLVKHLQKVLKIYTF
jgi:hypothetical protein